MSESEDWSYGALGESQDYRPPRDGIGQVLDALRDVQRRLSDLERGAPLRAAGVASEPDLLRVLGSLHVEGDATLTGDTAIGGSLDVSGDAAFSGDTEIGGTLGVSAATTIGGDLDVSGLLRILSSAIVSGNIRSQNFAAGSAGWRLTATGLEVNTLVAKDAIIGDDALVSPLKIVAAAPNTASGWGVSTGHTAKATSGITVPAGFSQCVVVAWANMHFMDSAANGGWVRATIQGSSGAEMGGLANLQLGQSASHTHGLSGLTGGSVITVSCDVRASVGTGGMPGNIAQVTAVGFFQR